MAYMAFLKDPAEAKRMHGVFLVSLDLISYYCVPPEESTKLLLPSVETYDVYLASGGPRGKNT